MKEHYKQSQPEAGVYRIVNVRNNKALLGSTPNLNSIRSKLEFAKSTNSPGVLDRRLRRDIELYGIDAFQLEVLDALETNTESTYEQRLEELTTLEALWREKLDPDLLY